MRNERKVTVHGVAGFAVKGVKLLGTDVRLTVFSRVSVHIERPIRGLIDRPIMAIPAQKNKGALVASVGSVGNPDGGLELSGDHPSVEPDSVLGKELDVPGVPVAVPIGNRSGIANGRPAYRPDANDLSSTVSAFHQLTPLKRPSP